MTPDEVVPAGGHRPLPRALDHASRPGDAAVDRLVIVHALDVLSERERVAVVLRYYEDLDEADTDAQEGSGP